jgi:hypothetical protein
VEVAVFDLHLVAEADGLLRRVVLNRRGRKGFAENAEALLLVATLLIP